MVSVARGWMAMEGSGTTVTEATTEVIALHPPAAGKEITAK
jgi:hypothetical protein